MIVSALVIMLVSLIGVVFSWKKFSGFLQKNKKYLITFAIGIFAVVTHSLTQETFHLAKSFPLAICSILGGVVFLYLATLFMPHHHHDTHDCCTKEHNLLNARRILLGDAIHNIGDGILLVSAFLINIHVGLIAAFGILLHELVQEIAEFFILKEAGYTTRKALIYNFLVSSTILIGITIGLFVSSIPVINIVFIGLAAGGFLYILVADLIPHTIRSIKKSGSANTHFFVCILGVLIMFSVGLLTPHNHEHEHSNNPIVENEHPQHNKDHNEHQEELQDSHHEHNEKSEKHPR